MNGAEALKRFEEEYLEKVLGFCYQKVNNRENAEDLSVEIALEVLKAIHSGKEIENLGAFVWSVSNHTFFKWLRSRKYGSTAYPDELLISLENIEDEYIRRETENILHREVALLSEKYRKAVVLYYFEGKSCSEIGTLLGKSGGTVKWWLHNARNSIREGFDAMREYGEKSYNFFIFRSNALITVFFLIAILIYMLITGKQGEKSYSLSNDLQDKEREMKNISSILYEAGYAKELRVYQYGEYLIRIWKNLMLSLIKPKLRLSAKNSIAQNCYRISLNMFVLMYFVAIGVGISKGVMTAGMLSAMAAYVADLNYAISTLGGFMETMGENVKLLAALFDYMKEIEDYDKHGILYFPDSPKGEIRIRNLSFSYPHTEKNVLKNINLDIKSGEHIAFVGKNGAGKTTLAYLIAGVYQPTKGNIYIDGVNIADLRGGELSRHIAMVSQKIQKFSLSLEDNILLDRAGKQNDMDELISDMGLETIVHSMENGRKEMLGKEFGKTELSGGEWQKLALARCFAFEKSIYLLDEPASALDPNMEHKLFRLFEKYSRNKTSIIISHRLGAIRQCDRIYFLEEGSIVNTGTHDELLSKCPEYAEAYHTQAKWFRNGG